MAHIGSWGTPDIGFTEWLNRLLGGYTNSQGGSELGITSDKEYTSKIKNPMESYALVNSTLPSVNKYATGDILGSNATRDNTGNSGGNSGGNNGGNNNQGRSGPSEADLAEMRRRAAIDNAKSQAGVYRNQGQSAFDTIKKAANAFRERSQGLYSNAGQEITDAFSNITGSNARMGSELQGEARKRGRAMGLGDSSKLGLMNKVMANLAATQGSAMSERGQNERANQALLQERMDAAQNQENQGTDYLNAMNDYAGQMERSGYDTANFDFSDMLNQIAGRATALRNIAPLESQALSQYSPNTANVVNTLNSVFQGMGANGNRGMANQPANLAAPSPYEEMLKKYRNAYQSVS